MAHTLTLRVRAVVVAGFVLVTATLMGASAASAQGVLGLVMDSRNHRPIPGAEVFLVDADGEFAASGVSNEDGRFVLMVGAEGTFDVVATSLGYHTNSGSTIKLKDTGMAWVEVELVPDAIEIPGLTVTQTKYVPVLDRRGYYTRKRRSLGRFIEPTDFEKNMHVPMREVLRRTPLFRSRGALGGRCPAAVIVNGMSRGQGVLDSPELRMRYIAGIEVYANAGLAPPEFQGMVPTACSMIVIWTDYSG